MLELNRAGLELLANGQGLYAGVLAQTATSPNVIATFFEGLLSFIAPCVLPLVPGYLSFISGVSMSRLANVQTRVPVEAAVGGGEAALVMGGQPGEQSEPEKLSGEDTRRVLFSALLFVAGFTTIFILFFGLFNFIIDTFGDIRLPVRIVSGLLVIVFGLHFMGVFRIGFLNMEKRLNLNGVKRASYAGAYLLGGAFAFGWTPCVGPFLTAAVFTAEQGSTLEGISLMLVYSAGLGIPFILAGLFFNKFLGFMARIKRHFQIIEIASGLLLVLVGILLITNNMTVLTQQLSTIRMPWQ
jgi:cytochrome c-type biogenesis protein